MRLAEQFVAAPQVVLTQPESYMHAPNFVSVMEYEVGLDPEADEVGYLLEGGKITKRIFAA